MSWIYIIGGFVLYIAIGGFIAGMCHTGSIPDDVMITSLWPIMILIFIIGLISKYPLKFGEFVYNKLETRRRNHGKQR